MFTTDLHLIHSPYFHDEFSAKEMLIITSTSSGVIFNKLLIEKCKFDHIESYQNNQCGPDIFFSLSKFGVRRP